MAKVNGLETTTELQRKEELDGFEEWHRIASFVVPAQL